MRLRWLLFVAVLLIALPSLRAEDEIEDRKGRFLRVFDSEVISVARFNHEYFFELLGVRAVIELDRSAPLERESKAYLTALLQGQKIILRLDDSHPGRSRPRTWAGYAYLEDGTCLNEEVLKRGYGRVDPSASFSRLEEFKALEEQAKAEGRGMWKNPETAEAEATPVCEHGGIAFSGACGVTHPVIVEESKVTPDYPRHSRRKKIEGRVVLSAVVTKEGTVRDVVALRSPNDEMSQSAIEAVQQWRYEPGRKDGEPVDVRFIVVVDFLLMR